MQTAPLVALCAAAASSVELRVDPRVESNAKANLFASVEEARDAMRAGLGKGQPRTVILAATDHVLNRPFELLEKDSGTEYAPITYKTEPDAVQGSRRQARLSGGIVIPPSAFSPAAVPSGAKGVHVADLKAYVNASSIGGLACPYPKQRMRVYYNDLPAVLARDPNVEGGTLHAPWRYAGYGSATPKNETVLLLNDSATGARWQAASSAPGADLWMHGFWRYDWRDTFIKVAGIQKAGSSSYAITRDAATPPQYPWKAGCRFYAVNALELLDAEGEYFIDSRAMKLYFSTGDKPLDGEVSVSVLPAVLQVKGANHTKFENLSLSMAQLDAVSISQASHVHVTNCTIADAGIACLSLSGSNSSVAASNIHSCGGSAVSISGGDDLTLTRGNVSAIGNAITGFALERRTYQPGVAFRGTGLYVANNTITNGPHAGITGGGLLNLFEHNVVRHMCFGSVDVGAFYVGRSWAQRGNVVRFNTFDTIRATERLAQRSCSQNAFYLDDQMSGWDFYGNTIINATTGVLIGGGRRNHIHSNLFVNNDRDIAFDNRGMTSGHDWGIGCEQNCSLKMGNVTTSCLYNALRDIRYQQAPFANRFPEVYDIYNYHPCVPVANVIEDNHFCHANSSGGGQFIDQSEATVRSWLSTMSNNLPDCSKAAMRTSH
jgi:hypothetical protein